MNAFIAKDEKLLQSRQFHLRQYEDQAIAASIQLFALNAIPNSRATKSTHRNLTESIA
jgi:hypothetical protein